MLAVAKTSTRVSDDLAMHVIYHRFRTHHGTMSNKQQLIITNCQVMLFILLRKS
jgi:hypothetical protein